MNHKHENSEAQRGQVRGSRSPKKWLEMEAKQAACVGGKQEEAHVSGVEFSLFILSFSLT